MCRKVGAIFLIALALFGGVAKAASEPETGEKITINLASRILTFYQNGKKKYMYHIGAGRWETPTPVGNFSILSMEENPEWVDPKDLKKRVASGEDNPLGYRWMEFKDGYYGIHGTNRPESIGGYVSNGCVRMLEKDVEQLFDAVEVGTPVEIRYERLVIEETDGGVAVYYIYPDGYCRQPLVVADVREKMEPLGLNTFLSDDEILAKIEASDGEPTYIGRVYRVFVDDRWLSGRAIEREGTIYAPALSLAVVTKRKVVWDMVEETATTELGMVRGYDIGGRLFVRAEDLKKLFRLQPEIDRPSRKLYLTTLMPVPEPPGRGANLPLLDAAGSITQPRGAAERKGAGK